jgi:glycosyltransferase involved in cell wall biosynthesis/SAM-dependent methyltransferase
VTGLDISIAVPGLPFDGNSATTKGLGGSETAGYYMARELAKLGHHVRLFSNCDSNGCQPGVYDRVTYYPLKEWEEFAKFVPHDVSIVQRLSTMFAAPTLARLNWLWCHDLALGRQKADAMGTMWNIDKIIVLSEYMKQQYQSVYEMPDHVFLQSRNGIDLSLFAGLGNIKRHRNRIVYAARPERGLDNLLRYVFPLMLKTDPNLELHLCGYQNAVGHLQQFYLEIDHLIRALGDRVTWHGALGKRQLYELYASCGAYVYPTPSQVNAPFCEISCISVMEAQAAGLPVIASNRGALKESIKGGVLVDGDPWTPEYVRKFVDATFSVLTDDAKYKELQATAYAHASTLGWSGAAAQWSTEMEQQLRGLSNSPDRLAFHFWKHSDIMAAREVVNRFPAQVDKGLIQRIETDFAFTKNADTYRQQYEKIGETHGPLVKHHVDELRFQILEDWVNKHTECTRILDWGCAYGSYLLNLVPRVKDREWVGIDIDKNSIALAKKHRQDEFGLTEADVQLLTVEEAKKVGPGLFKGMKRANSLILFEVLEHVVDPVALINEVEKYVEPGGKIFITVPYGPWEYESYYDYPHRCHLWEYDWHDLRDLFNKKDDLIIAPIFGGVGMGLNKPLGWWMVEYTVSNKPTGSIDMDRKLWLQRPKETVSATLIAGGPHCEDTLHWCLKSLQHLADEVVIVDCGMTEEALRIVGSHGKNFPSRQITVVKGVDPKTEGFEAPRNLGLQHCTKDWIFWLDTDEKLLGLESIHKYMRNNMYDGYCIKQVHFACDTTFEPDNPVRLFRRVRHDGKKMQWYGMIHEHPETALNEGPGVVITLGDVWIPHVGYLSERIRRGRFDRNLPLLAKDMEKYPDRLLQKHFIIRDKMMMNMHELQRTGNKITPAIKQRCEEVIEMYRKHFRGKETYSGVNTLQYYSQACDILGLGAAVGFQIAAAREGMPPLNGAKVYRFATMEDLESEMLRLTRETASQYMDTMW